MLALGRPFGQQPGDVAGKVGESTGETRASELAEQILPRVQELRALEFKRTVPIEVIDDDEAREYMRRRFQEFLSPGELEQLQRAYALLGLIPEGLDIMKTFLDVLREQAGGFYDPDSGSFYVLDDIPESMGPMVIAHELTHALEDQHFDLDKRLHEVEEDDDRLFARSAIHEGSAVLVMSLYTAQAIINGELDAKSIEAFADSEVVQMETLEALPVVFQRQLMAPYLIGSSFLVRGNMMQLMSGGFPVADVDRVYGEPPESSEQILHPPKYWDPDQRDDPQAIELAGAGEALGRRWRKQYAGTLGELTLGVIVGAPTPLRQGAAQSGDRWTNAAASGWDGDRFELWSKGKSAVVLLATVWDSADDAREFADALPARDDLRWRVEGDRVAIVAGDAVHKTEAVLARILQVSSD